MPQLQRRIRPRISPRSQLPALTLGVFIGCAFMYILMMPLHLKLQPEGNEELPPQYLRSRDDDAGWHTLHVFYGDEKGLGAPAFKKWFSQAHQDEIVVDLLGNNGYFIDLAANDAKELSNTLSLERKGWNGT